MKKRGVKMTEREEKLLHKEPRTNEEWKVIEEMSRQWKEGKLSCREIIERGANKLEKLKRDEND